MVTALEGVFWLCAALVLYTYAGYPLLLALLVRIHPAPAVVRRSDFAPPVTLIIVAHDEEGNIGAKLADCLAQEYAGTIDVIVVSDGSSDATDAIVTAHAARGVRLLRIAGPRGKPTGLNQAVLQAAGDILVLCDARQRLDPGAVRHLVAPFADPTIGAVSGELHIARDEARSAMGGGVGAYWAFEKWIRRHEAALDSCVGVTGAIYAVRRELYRALDPSTILDDVAVPMAVVAQGYRVVFEREARAYDRPAGSAADEYRRKVRTLAGNYQLVALHPWLLDPRRNRLAWQFASHKLLRLVAPWAIALAVMATLARVAIGRSVAFDAMAAVELLVIGGAAAGFLLQHRGRTVPVLSVLSAFAVLNVAAAVALFSFRRGAVRPNWRSVRDAP